MNTTKSFTKLFKFSKVAVSIHPTLESKMKTRFPFCFVPLLIAVLLHSSIDTKRSHAHPDENASSEWPQWRGPNRDGIAYATGRLQSWPESGPKVLWRVPAGAGYSGISIANEKLYTMWDEGETQFLICSEAASGKELWRHKVGASFYNSYGCGPRSSPTVSEPLVYAISTAGNLHAVDTKTGKLRWRHDLAGEYGGSIPSIDYSSSPLIDGDRLFVEVGGKENSAFMAFDKTTGKVLWASQTDQPAYSSPLAVTLNGTRQIIFFSASGLFAVSPHDGKLFWKYAWQSNCPATGIPLNTATPIFIAPDKVFISSGYGTGEGAAVIKIKGSVERFEVETVWTEKVLRTQVNSAVLYENYLYGFDVGTFKCVDAMTGEEKWRVRGFQRGSLIAAGGHLLVLGERGKLALVPVNPSEFKEAASVEILQGKCWTMPTLAGGRLYLRNEKEMLCLELQS